MIAIRSRVSDDSSIPVSRITFCLARGSISSTSEIARDVRYIPAAKPPRPPVLCIEQCSPSRCLRSLNGQVFNLAPRLGNSSFAEKNRDILLFPISGLRKYHRQGHHNCPPIVLYPASWLAGRQQRSCWRFASASPNTNRTRSFCQARKYVLVVKRKAKG